MMQIDDPQQQLNKNDSLHHHHHHPPHFINDDDDDDNAAIESDTSKTIDDDEEDSPLLIALDDLESRVVTVLNEFKSHSGRASHPSTTNIHEELSSVLRPVVEISSHTSPSTARSLSSSYPHILNIDLCVDEMYQRLNSELILPVILECAQSDLVPAKRSACLALFHSLHIEWQKAGSYLDGTTSVPSLSGPYGPGVTSTAIVSAPPYSAADANRRTQIRSMRKSELLRRWVQSALPNLAPGAFTSSSLDCSVASRGVLSASAALKPCLRYMAERIGNADDAGALRLFLPVMRMIAGVLGRLFLERVRAASGGASGTAAGVGDDPASDSLRATCIKFLEIVILCFSNRSIPGAAAGSHAALRMQKGGGNKDANDFSLEDLPPGHPIITREGLEEIGEYCFSTLRGLVLLGGQAAIDPSLLVAATTASSSLGGSSPFSQILDILKPAALAFLKVESAAEKAGFEFVLDRTRIDLDFALTQKSYSLAINAVQMLATKRPVFFKDSSTCLARRTIDPPGGVTGRAEGLLTKAAVTGIRTHLRSSCLTLLRNFLSVTSGCWEILCTALTQAEMKAQADRALQASRQQLDLMMGGRAARNRAAIFYEWDTSADDSRAAKRQRDTDDAEVRVRAAKMARGLGSGIQLPTNMVDACELVLLNLNNLPSKRPPVAVSTRKHAINLDFVLDAVITNGASLSIDENHWYDRDGGEAWIVNEEEDVGEYSRKTLTFTLNRKVFTAAEKTAQGSELNESEKAFAEQSKLAASMAFSRILRSSSSAHSEAVANFGKRLAARLAWTLKGVQPSNDIEGAHAMAVEATEKSLRKDTDSEETLVGSLEFALEYPLVSSCLAFDLVPKGTEIPIQDDSGGTNSVSSTSSLSMRILNEAFKSSFNDNKENYEKCLDVFVSSVVNACDLSNKTPNDSEKKRIANAAASSLPQQLAVVPCVTRTALNLVGSLCDIDEISKRASTKTPQQTIAESAGLHAAKAAAEKRAMASLLILRDVALQRDAMRGPAVDCAVAIASGRLPGSASIEDKALKLVMNVIFSNNTDCANKVVESATKELELATRYAIDNHEMIVNANESIAKKKEKDRHGAKGLQSDEEKVALNRVRKPVVLFMALCVRRPKIIKELMEMSCREGADILAKAVKANMPKLTKAVSVKFGAANIARQVSDMASEKEVPLLLSFLDHLAPSNDSSMPSQELIDACHEIQTNRLDESGNIDSRYITPVVSAMKRNELVLKLPEFVRGSDDIFKLSLKRMAERLGRYAMIFREEPDTSESTLRGMSSCEQLVYLHHLDFHTAGIPQKRYLDSIRLCLENDEVFTDRVIQAALDYMSGKNLEGESLPLAYMRTIILTCSKHESLHSWICHVLLPRLVEGKVYADKRQWEGWMRCAKMLESSRDHGVSSLDAIKKLPAEQLKLYRAKYPQE